MSELLLLAIVQGLHWIILSLLSQKDIYGEFSNAEPRRGDLNALHEINPPVASAVLRLREDGYSNITCPRKGKADGSCVVNIPEIDYHGSQVNGFMPKDGAESVPVDKVGFALTHCRECVHATLPEGGGEVHE